MTSPRRVAVLGLVAVVSGLVAGCSPDRLEGGGVRLRVERGARVLAAERGERLRPVRGERTLPRGASVEVVTGSARVGLESGSAELRQGSRLELGDLPMLVAGDALVASPEDRPMTLAAAGSRLTVAGAARLSRDLAVSAASYSGVVTLQSAGRSLRVPALRQAAVPSLGLLPPAPQPLAYDARDPWDRRFLGAAIELGEELQSKSRGFTASLAPGQGRAPEFFRRLVPGLDTEPGLGPPVLSPVRPPGETLVGTVIAVSGRRGALAARLVEVFSFRDEGAAWGLVALDQGVGEFGPLVQSVDAAIGRAPLAFSPPPPIAAPVPGPPARQPGPRAPARPAPPPPARVVPVAPPAPTAGPAPPARRPSLLDPLVTPLVDTLNGLLSGG